MTGLPRLKLALLGCGDVAQRDYLPEIHRLSDRVELVAVCSRTEQRARDVAAQYGARAWYTDYARMLAESDADLVANLTPIQLHAETTLAAFAVIIGLTAIYLAYLTLRRHWRRKRGLPVSTPPIPLQRVEGGLERPAQLRRR